MKKFILTLLALFLFAGTISAEVVGRDVYHDDSDPNFEITTMTVWVNSEAEAKYYYGVLMETSRQELGAVSVVSSRAAEIRNLAQRSYALDRGTSVESIPLSSRTDWFVRIVIVENTAEVVVLAEYIFTPETKIAIGTTRALFGDTVSIKEFSVLVHTK